MAHKRDSASPYDAAIADLKEKRAKIDAMIMQLEQIKSVGVPTGASPTSEGNSTPILEIQEDTFFNMNALDATKKFLRMSPKTPRTVEEICEALNKGGQTLKKKSLYTILGRDVSAGEIAKVKKKWGLKEWYNQQGN